VKVIYVAPEHVSGGFSLFASGHRSRGNECRWTTFFRSEFDFPEDICFNLLGMPNRGWGRWLRRIVKHSAGQAEVIDLPDTLPVWQPGSAFEYLLFRLRDAINAPRIRRAIERWNLNEFDIYHFEQGIDPFRDGRWVRELAARGKGIVCFYHGTDIRNRGIIPAVHKASALNMTSEIDLLDRLPGMRYLYLPIDTEELHPHPRPEDGRIRICHAARNRMLKGSDLIEEVVCRLAERYPVDWVMIENMTHKRAIEVKAGCDIFVDQVTDRGGWGYGASSVEALALGLPTLTRINTQVADFLCEHPFIPATPETLEAELTGLIEDKARRRELGLAGRQWVTQRHGLDSVMDTLYGYYRDAGLI